MARKRVLIIGGGVAALAAATALVEHNEKKARTEDERFDIHVMTSDEIWGGRASSWPGGGTRSRYETDEAADHGRHWVLRSWDFQYWPPEVPLNHGFHAVFAESTYVNFWYTLKLAGLSPEHLKGKDLISNDFEILVQEAETGNVCRMPIIDPTTYPPPLNSHLTKAAWEAFRHGGWSLGEILSFKQRVFDAIVSYSTFDELAHLDTYQRISFIKWCRDRGVRETIFNKMMFKFLFQGTYIAPNTMDATSAIMGLWILLRHRAAAEWFYINGGITEKLMQPIANYLDRKKVGLHCMEEVTRFLTNDDYSSIVGYATRVPNQKGTTNEKGQPAGHDSQGPFDYYISTLPINSLVQVLSKSWPLPEKEPSQDDVTLLDVFPDIKTLMRDKRFAQPAGTVNLQAWFQRKGLLKDMRDATGGYRNVIAGFEPLCVLIDYKNTLPMYKNDDRFPGSVLEINGALQELQSPENYGYFECDHRFGAPHEDTTIEFAKAIMIDLAKRYKFPDLKKAVEENAFLVWPEDWKGRRFWNDKKVPPFLWKNTDPYSRFFVTGPGTLQYRPWIWRRAYPLEYRTMRRTLPKNALPKGYPDNFFLAGDWTRNGFDVPCMEGAARSGRMAALAVINKARGEDPEMDPTKTEAEVQRERTRPQDDYIEVFDPY